MKTLTATLLIALALPGVAMAKSKKVKTVSTPVVTVTPAPVPTAPVAPTPAPKSTFMEQQIAAALANKSPVGVTTYGAMAAAVAAGQNGGDPIAAAEAASAGF